MATQQVSIHPQDVIHETVDGEVIVIALSTGSYYSLEGSGALIWEGLVAGRSPDEIVAELRQGYAAEPGVIEEAVSDLVTQLVAERLLYVVESNGHRPAAAQLNGDAGTDRPRFELPVLHTFTDMQDFLLVDPVHEVGDEGWPHPPSLE